MNRGEIFLANLNPSRGSEQSGIRPSLLFNAIRSDVLRKQHWLFLLVVTYVDRISQGQSQFPLAKVDSLKIQLHFATKQ